ncbi:murein biosynthesis integral membrane protein MurJ [Buchnera aphidicola]|uniref:murein biosynthesis integral membrane protein MurJ n=1 Tax=Buchnera aphidicola TaxID=9 RepID=UPI0034648CC6
MNLLKSLINISMITFLSRILSFLRDFIIAYTFGVSIATDSFFIAFKVPNLLRRIFAEGAFLQVIIPIFVKYKKKENINLTRQFFSYILGFMILILSCVIFLGFFFAPYIVLIVAPGFFKKPEEFILATKLLRITFPYVFFISLASLTTAILNIWGYFLIPVFSPILLNISMISFILIFTKYFQIPILSLAWSVIIGGCLQFLYQFLYLKKINMLVRPRINLHIPEISSLVSKIGIGVLGVSANHVSLFINGILASLFISGSVSWMYYADRLIELPVGILGISLGTILLSCLTKSFANNAEVAFSKLLDWGLRVGLLISLPSSIILYILSHPIIAVLFQYGKFTQFDTIMTEKSLIGYAIGLIALILVKILSPAFYARQDTITPMIISIITIIITQSINVVLLSTSLGYFGLSISISISAWLNSALLYWYLYKNKIFFPQPGWCSFISKIIIASFAMSIFLIFILHIITSWDVGIIIYRLFRLLFVLFCAILIYFTTLFLLGVRLSHFYFKVKI